MSDSGSHQSPGRLYLVPHLLRLQINEYKSSSWVPNLLDFVEQRPGGNKHLTCILSPDSGYSFDGLDFSLDPPDYFEVFVFFTK